MREGGRVGRKRRREMEGGREGGRKGRRERNRPERDKESREIVRPLCCVVLKS